MDQQPMFSDALDKILPALLHVQSKAKPLGKNKSNEHFNYKYVDLAAIYEEIQPLMTEAELIVVQQLVPEEDNRLTLQTTIFHTSGQWIGSVFRMPYRGNSTPQAIGSIITYARRYSLLALLGLVATDDDDDGAAGSNTEKAARQTRDAKLFNSNPMTARQSKRLMAYLTKRHGDDREAYCNELSSFFGRTIRSSRELTKDDCRAPTSVVYGGKNEEEPPYEDEY